MFQTTNHWGTVVGWFQLLNLTSHTQFHLSHSEQRHGQATEYMETQPA
jgi:hypothetical protein